MSKDIADDIVSNCRTWARDAGVTRIEFTYGVLYGTKKLSNKKDWHVLRNICEKLPRTSVITNPENRWNCSFALDGINVDVAVRIGVDWWSHLGGSGSAFVELCVALIRACVTPTDTQDNNPTYTISDLADIVSTTDVPDRFNVGMLQRSQIEWLFFIARHFCDRITTGDMTTLRIN